MKTTLRLGLLIVSVLVGGELSCTWTLSQKRQQRISDCLAQCNQGQAPERGAMRPGDGLADQRSSCEQHCHSLR